MPRLKPLKPGRTESQVLAAVLDALACFGIDAERQNTGAAINPRGRLVRFGQRGNSDVAGIIPTGWGSASGKVLHIEVKRESFNPPRLRGVKREHFDRQLARLVRTNEAGGFGMWVHDAAEVIHALGRIREGWRIDFDGDWPILVSPDEAVAAYTPRGEAEAPPAV